MTIRDMVARHSNYAKTKDFIPTPPWATRALYEFVVPVLKEKAPTLSAWDPACGHFHMLDVFKEMNHKFVLGSDVMLYDDETIEEAKEAGYNIWINDFTSDGVDVPPDRAGVIITNPPYAHLAQFIDMALARADFGVGMLVRVQALESEDRYNRIFSYRPPTQIAFFANRIPFKTGVIAQKAPKMFFHTWLWWQKDETGRLVPPNPPTWIPYDAQTQLEKDSDYGQ